MSDGEATLVGDGFGYSVCVKSNFTAITLLKADPDGFDMIIFRN